MILIGGLLADQSAGAMIYNVGNNSAVTTALGSVNPGDTIVISNGNYSGFTITRSGTAANPITIQAQNLLLATNNTGIIKFAGVSNVILSGLTLTTSGGSHTVDGTSRNVGVVLTNCIRCRVTHCNFKLTGAASGTAWVMLGGPSYSNRVDHCDFGPNSVSGHTHYIWPGGNATISGVTAPPDRTAWAMGYGPFNPNIARYSRIDHNNFHDQASGVGEVMVLGAFGVTGDYQDIYTLIEYNYFNSCNGDAEIISAKASNNTLRYNTVTNSFGRFSLRAGNNSSIYGNYFFGSADGTAWSGIKMDERDHKIFNNYIESPSDFPILLVSGSLYDFGFQQAQVVRAQVVHNTVIGPGRPVQLGLGSGLPPTDCVFANNIITGSGTTYTEGVTPFNLVRSQNIIFGYNPGKSGFLVEDPLLTGSSPQRLSAASPAINNGDTNYFPYVTDDMEGQTRSIPRDIGADEYSASPFMARPPLTPNDVGPNSVDIELTATPSAQAVTIGATNVSYAIAVTSDPGFTDLVTLTVNGLLPGMSAGFNPPAVNGSGVVTLNITNTSSVLGGNYPFIVTATSGSLQTSETVTLQVGRSASNLRWASTSSGVWNLQSAANWFNISSNVADAFYNGDSLLFDDSNSVQTALTIAAGVAVSPSVVTNNSSTNNFTISGAGKITGATKFVKTGSSMLTLNTTNDFGGGMLIAGGTLKAGNPYALGGQGGFIIITNGATLDVNGYNLGMDAVLVSGAGVSSNGAIINNGADVYPALAVIELAGDTTIGGAHRWDLRATSSTIPASLSTSGNAYNLSKIGTNFIGIVSVTVDTALGDINVQSGTLDIEAATTSLGNPGRTLTVYTNATLEFWNTVYDTNNLNLNKRFVLKDGATILNGSGANILLGQTTLNGNDTFNIGGTSLTCSNSFTGSGKLIKTGGSTLNLAGAATSIGGVIVSNGTVAVTGAVSGSPITIASGATLSVSGTVSGGGNCISGGTLAMNGGTLAFSVSSGVTNANIGTLSFAGTSNTIAATSLPPITSLPAQFPLVKFTSESGAFNFVAGSIAGGYGGFISNNTTKATVDLVITNSPPVLIWNGAGSAEWDLTTANWSNSVSAISPVAFQNGNIVIFDDSVTNAPAARTNLDLASGIVVQPGAVVVNNFGVNYGITGSGSVSGSASLTKQGSGTLTLGTLNSFLGGVTINNGAVQVFGGSGNSSLGGGDTTVNAGGTLIGANADAFGYAFGHNNPGSIFINGGVVTDVGTSNYRITLPNLIFTGGTLTSANGNNGDASGNFCFFGDATTSTVTTLSNNTTAVISAKKISFHSVPTTFNVAAGNVTGGTYPGVDLVISSVITNFSSTDIQGFSKTGAGVMVVDASNPLYSGAVTNNAGTLQLGAASDASSLIQPLGANIIVNNANLNFASSKGITVSNIISGTGSLAVNSGINLLTAANTYTGATAINNGTLTVNGSLAPGSAVTVTTNGTLAGIGTIGGSVIVNGTIEPGSPSAIGTLTCSSAVTLNGTNVMKLNKSAQTNDALSVAGGLAYGGVLNVPNQSGTLMAGDSFMLFSVPGSGAFTSIVPATPGAGLLWNTNTLTTDGTLRIASTVVPLPHITSISLFGTTLNLTATNGVVGGRYVLLQSTNVALPLAQWSPVLTNHFDSSGNLNLSTNIVNPNNPQAFYILSQ